jgi:hypothetical protein
MSNYQILEIALEVAFFATVASIAVIFAIVRERSLKKRLADQSVERLLNFPDMLNEASASVSGNRDGGVSEDEVAQSAGRQTRVLERCHSGQVLSRAERELMSGIAAGQS